jgi:hypothetical protein
VCDILWVGVGDIVCGSGWVVVCECAGVRVCVVWKKLQKRDHSFDDDKLCSCLWLCRPRVDSCSHSRPKALTDGRVHQRGEAAGRSVVARQDAVELLVAREMEEGGAAERGAAEADGRQVLVLLLCFVVVVVDVG